mmetsp:Transcript_36920/g.86518  ORF Transcript_36920/g.86518 Transcript_36920/m.86518 type:complete len:270 (-) Transcript_36920:7-816(-)
MTHPSSPSTSPRRGMCAEATLKAVTLRCSACAARALPSPSCASNLAEPLLLPPLSDSPQSPGGRCTREILMGSPQKHHSRPWPFCTVLCSIDWITPASSCLVYRPASDGRHIMGPHLPSSCNCHDTSSAGTSSSSSSLCESVSLRLAQLDPLAGPSSCAVSRAAPCGSSGSSKDCPPRSDTTAPPPSSSSASFQRTSLSFVAAPTITSPLAPGALPCAATKTSSTETGGASKAAPPPPSPDDIPCAPGGGERRRKPSAHTPATTQVPPS